MRVWIYSRLSNDDDREMNSLLNQQEICRAFAERQGHQVIGQSSDDNASGMNFSRRGLEEQRRTAFLPRLCQGSSDLCHRRSGHRLG